MLTPINSIATSSNVSLALCGRFAEITIYPENVYSGQGECKKGDGFDKGEPETPDDIKRRSAQRARRNVRRLCNSNEMWYMHTLTYAVNHIEYFQGEKPFILVPLEKQKNRDSVITHWKAFARKMRKREEKKGREFFYIAVIERHTGKRANDKTIKDGCFHVHFVSNRLYDKRLLQHVWTHGLCNHSDWSKGRKKRDLDNVDTLPPVDNPGAYLSKYIGKDAEETEQGRKSYWASRNLRKPVTLYGQEALEIAICGNKIWERNNVIELPNDRRVIFKQQTRLLPSTLQYDFVSPPKPTTKEEKRQVKALNRVLLHDLKKSNERAKEMVRQTSVPSVEEYFDRRRYLTAQR